MFLFCFSFIRYEKDLKSKHPQYHHMMWLKSNQNSSSWFQSIYLLKTFNRKVSCKNAFSKHLGTAEIWSRHSIYESVPIPLLVGTEMKLLSSHLVPCKNKSQPDPKFGKFNLIKKKYGVDFWRIQLTTEIFSKVAWLENLKQEYYIYFNFSTYLI